MNNLIVLLLSLTLSVSLSNAQSNTWNEQTKEEMRKNGANKSPEERASKQTKQLSKALRLSTEQQAEVETALVEYHTNMKAVRQSAEKDLEQMTKEERQMMKSKHLEHQDALKNKMKTILNEEQYAEFLQKMGDLQRKGRKPRT